MHFLINNGGANYVIERTSKAACVEILIYLQNITCGDEIEPPLNTNLCRYQCSWAMLLS